MKSHAVNYLDQRNKILGLTPQQLINPKLLGMRNKFLSWLLKDVEIDEMKIKHLDITGKNTMTTPKIKLTNSGADPALDGEITMNDTTIKGKSDGSVINFGRSIQTQLGQLSELIGSGSGSFTAFGGNLNTTWTTKVSRTITPDSVPNKVVIAGYASGHSTGTGTSIYLRVREGGVNVTSEVSDAPSFSDNPVGVSANAILDDVSDSSKTYDAQVKQDFNHVRLAYCSLYVAVIKLA